MNTIRNNKQAYRLIATEIEIEKQTCITYGIEGANTLFKDVSTDRQKVEEMVNRINNEQLEESQLGYFIADELDR